MAHLVQIGCLTLGLLLGLNEKPASAQAKPSGVRQIGATDRDLNGPRKEHPLRPAIREARKCLKALEPVRDYECLFAKRELINGKLVVQSMSMRLREKPFSVYMRFGAPFTGREVLYVEGQNGNQLLAHEGSGVKSLFGTVSLALDSPEIKAENRHRITEIGMKNLVRLLIKQWEAETPYGEIDVKYYPNAKIGKRSCRVIEASHPRPRRQFRFHITRLYIDDETNFPIRLENYLWPRQPGGQPLLVEEYTFSNIRTNVGLTDRHFDPNNPDYNF